MAVKSGFTHMPTMDDARSRWVTGAGIHRSVVRALVPLTAYSILLPFLFAGGPGLTARGLDGNSLTNAAAGLRTLTTAREAHNLSNEEASRGYPIHLRGVITYLDPDWGDLGKAAIFIHDATGSVYISQTSEQARNLFVGAFVDVRGDSFPGGYGPIVANPQMRVLGRAALPAAPLVTLARLRTGVEDAQWVEVEGSVHSVIEYKHSVTLRLEMEDGLVSVVMLEDPGANYSRLVDAEVKIRANAAPTVNDDGQLIGVRLQAPNLSTLEVIEPAPRDPFSRPPVAIEKLLTWGHYFTSMHRIHLRGNVTLQWPGSLLCIRDATRGICAETTQETPVALGELVDVAGFAGTVNHAPFITDAVFRDAGSNLAVRPQPATAERILSGGFGSQLIRIDGQLIGYDLTTSDATLLLSSGNTFFPVILPKSLAGGGASAWRVGSRLRITGICSVSIDTESHVREGTIVTQSFRVLMRSPADVRVLELPSWWTPTRAIVVLALALLATLVILVWAIVLKRRVDQQAALLRASESQFRHMALHDALTGLATRILMHDRLNVALEGARRRRACLAVLMIDLDKFKEVNDTYGHQAGDEVLRISAKRLLQSVRKEDTVARIGGDEFVVLLPDLADEAAAEMVAEKIVKRIATPIQINGREVPITVSMGICAATAGEFDEDALLRNADAALYEAKEHGRNCYRIFSLETFRTGAKR